MISLRTDTRRRTVPHTDTTGEITIQRDTYQIAVDDAVTFTACRSRNGDVRRHKGKASHYPNPDVQVGLDGGADGGAVSLRLIGYRFTPVEV
jgi:hypothetical protein